MLFLEFRNEMFSINCSYLLVKSDQCQLDVECQQIRVRTDHHMAILLVVTSQCLRIKVKSVREDRRARVVLHMLEKGIEQQTANSL